MVLDGSESDKIIFDSFWLPSYTKMQNGRQVSKFWSISSFHKRSKSHGANVVHTHRRNFRQALMLKSTLFQDGHKIQNGGRSQCLGHEIPILFESYIFGLRHIQVEILEEPNIFQPRDLVN